MLKSVVQYVLPKADILFTAAKSGVLYIRAEVSDIVLNPDSANRQIFEILMTNDLVSIGSNKSFTDSNNTPSDVITDVVFNLNKVEIVPAAELLSRTVFYNRNFADNTSAIDPNRLVKPGNPINASVFNSEVMGWSFFGTRELLVNTTKVEADAVTPSEVADYTVNKYLNEGPIINDSVSITLDFDSTLTDEATATENAIVLLHTFFVMNGAMLNNRPIN